MTLTDFVMQRSSVTVTVCSTCQTCGGRLVARTNAVGTRHTGRWAHVANVDHEAAPTEAGIANLARTMAGER